MKNNLFVIGDSFCRDTFYVKSRINEIKSFWVEDLKKRFNNIDTLCDGAPSRDLQTIIDTWIKLIKHIGKDDYLVICVPYFRRSRLPFSKNNYHHIEFKNINIVNRFVGTHSSKGAELEFWGKNYKYEYFLNQLSVQEIINSSYASQINYIEIIESLYHLTNGKKYVFSWDEMDIKSDFIEDKNIITKNIGFWETHRDVFYETDGEFGLENDVHWSFRMNEFFSDYVFEKLTK